MSKKRFKTLPIPGLTFLVLLCLFLAACQEDPPQAVPTEAEAIPTAAQADPTAPTDEATATPAQQSETIGGGLEEPFSLAAGQTIRFTEVPFVITFNSVVEDNRCPAAVDCIQSGPVIIMVTAEVEGQPPASFEMNPDLVLAESGSPPNVVTYQGYEIQLTAVNPYPEQPEDTLNMAYTATFFVR